MTTSTPGAPVAAPSGSAALPWWAQALDAVSLGALALFLSIAVFGGD